MDGGMTDMTFSYEEYEKTREELHEYVIDGLNDNDKRFLVSFEEGNPDWSLCAAADLSIYPSVQWKMLNLQKLANLNPAKLGENVKRLKTAFGM